MTRAARVRAAVAEVAVKDAPRALPGLAGAHATLDRALVEAALHASGGKVAAAARALGISRVTLWRRMRRYRPGTA